MEGECGVTQSIIDDHHSFDIQGDQMEGEGDVSRSIVDELHSWDIQRDQMEIEGGGTRRVINELIPGISKEIKFNVKLV